MAKNIPGKRIQQPGDEDGQQSPLFEQDTPKQIYDDQLDKNLTQPKAQPDKSMSPGGLEKAEQEGGDGTSTAVGGAESNLGKGEDSLYSPSDNSGGNKDFGARLRGLATKRNAAIGGGIGGIVGIVIVLLLGFASYEAVHVRELMVGRGNSIVNQALFKRRQRSFARTIKRFNQGKMPRLSSQKMASRLEKQGFKTGFEGGKLTKLEYEYKTTSGETKQHKWDFAEDDTRVAAKKFFDGPQDAASKNVGKDIAKSFDDATGGRGQTWRGRAARRTYGRIRTQLKDWLKPRDGPEDKNKTDQEKLAEDGREIDTADREASAAERRIALGLTPEEENKNGGGSQDPKLKDNGKQPDDSQDPEKDGKFHNEDSVNKASKTDYKNSVEEVTDSSTKVRQDGQAYKGSNPDLASSEGSNINHYFSKEGMNQNSYNSLKDSLIHEHPKFKERLGSIADPMNIAAIPRAACKIKGTINFIDNIKSVYLAIALARFSTRFLTAADNQKAGLIQGEGLSLFMKWLHTPSPVTGRTYTQAGGFQNVIMGNKDARPSNADRGKYSVARRQGVWGTIYNFVDNVPLSTPKSCRTLNNGWVQIAGVLPGMVAAIFSGGSSAVAENLVVGFGMNLAQEYVFSQGEQLVIRMVTGRVIDWAEKGEQAGDALSAGWGALKAMNGGANGLKPITKDNAAKLALEAKQEHQYEMSQQSIFARYFDLKNADSLASNLGFALATNANMRPASAIAGGLSILNPAKFAGGFAGMLSGLVPKANAQQSASEKYFAKDEPDPNECTDPQIKDHNLEADVFCNPVLAETPNVDDNTEQLLLNYKDEKTHQPRPLIHGAKNSDNTDDPQQGDAINYPQENEKNTPETDLYDFIALCHGGRPNLLYEDKPDQSGDNKSTDNKCFENGKPLPGDSVGRYKRFSDWYAYHTDEQNNIETINEQYDNVTQNPADSETDPSDPNSIPAGCPGGPAGPPAPGTICPSSGGGGTGGPVGGGPGGNPPSGSGGGPGNTSSQTVQDLAKEILANSNISYPLDCCSTNGSTKSVLEALARGEKAPVLCRDGSAGGTINADIEPNMLRFVRDLGKKGPLGVNALTDKCHSTGSKHYQGLAVDFECRGVPFDTASADPIAQQYGGARNSETCSGNNHWHYQFNRS